MKLLPVAVILSIVSYTCGAVKEHKKIKGVKYTVYFPKIDRQGKLTGYDTLIKKLYFYGNQVACNFMYRYGTFENDILVKSEWKHLHSTFSKGSQYGLVFEQNDYKAGRKILTDSILKMYWPNVYADSAISRQRNYVQLIDSSFNSNSGILTEKYFVKDGMDTSNQFDLVLKYSNKLMLKEYSFSEKLDSLRKMKLYYYKAIVKPRYFGKQHLLTDYFETTSFFEEIPVTNENELMHYFSEEKKLNGSGSRD